MQRNDEIQRYPQFVSYLQQIGVDAVIINDMGALMLTKQYAPGMELHISTQSGITNFQTARAFYELGAKRVVLARELSLEEIAEIRAKTPADLELEVFVHGAMCMSISGRCLISNYLTDRDANRGQCAQPLPVEIPFGGGKAPRGILSHCRGAGWRGLHPQRQGSVHDPASG